jgi:hypothetical protein
VTVDASGGGMSTISLSESSSSDSTSLPARHSSELSSGESSRLDDTSNEKEDDACRQWPVTVSDASFTQVLGPRLAGEDVPDAAVEFQTICGFERRPEQKRP